MKRPSPRGEPSAPSAARAALDRRLVRPRTHGRPIRLQLSRREGSNLEALSRATNGLAAVNVARPSRWGNPFKVDPGRGYEALDCVADYNRWLAGDRAAERLAGPPPSATEIAAALRGKNLACWCPLGRPCHADVLLRVANS